MVQIANVPVLLRYMYVYMHKCTHILAKSWTLLSDKKKHIYIPVFTKLLFLFFYFSFIFISWRLITSLLRFFITRTYTDENPLCIILSLYSIYRLSEL